MANIATLLNTIKAAVYGKDMRLALHDAIEATNDDVETKEPILTAGTSSQYYRGDKTWQDLPTPVRNTSLSGLSTSNTSAITSSDTVLTAFGRLQAQINTTERSANKGVANGYAGLDSTGKVPVGQLPDIAIADTFVVNSQSAMLALTAQTGDVAVRTDLNKSFILKASPSTTLENWQELLTPTDAVLSVNGKTGAVVVSKTDVGLGNVDNTADDSKSVYSASRLTTERTINGVSFDGTADITITDNTSPHFTIAPANAVNKERADLVLTGVPADDLAAINNAITALHTARASTDVAIRIDFLGGNIDLGIVESASAIVIPLGYDNIHLYGNGVKITGHVWGTEGEGHKSVLDIIGHSCIIDGFDILNNYGDYALSNTGTNCTISGNTCSGNHDGLLNTGSNCTITGNTCSSSSSTGLRNDGTNCTISGNTCSSELAALHNTGINCAITGNTCSSEYDNGLSNIGTNCTITGNNCNSERYNGLSNAGINCTITGNNCSSERDNGLYNSSISTTDKCIITGNICLNGGISVKSGTCLPATQAAMADVNTGSVTLRA